MHLTHLIIDDFFDDPLAVRRLALAQDYPPRPERAAYPGRNASRALSFPGLERMVSNIVHEKVGPADYASHCVPRLALEGNESKANVHIDFNHWSAIVYLTLDKDCQDGTHFYRHKATGLDRAPVFDNEAQQAGFATSRDAVKTILDADGRRAQAWERLMTIPMKFNRLALFRGYLWHDAGVSFGADPESGRLILPFFFETAM
jgi:hypothetical protein